ncbi:hypothetical protein [Spirosoma sp. KCTC 42546]|uniref:hypothetical protein n=1 Tax=Spirosoma sp. KCTC 42546 TaxID=2520506 RepID=UPI00143D101D|nr:hypothetical protein [Spirosoma sp. KCTC 42546]
MPALSLYNGSTLAKEILVEQGIIPDNLKNNAFKNELFSKYNDNEFRHEIPKVARYYITQGEYIIIEPLCNNWNEILLYFYANCLSIALFQRNQLPFHVSGIFVKSDSVLLFAGPSQVGKSTTALMLQQKGYAPFTDDTALLTVENGICFAQASYPMMRLWQSTIDQQTLFQEAEKQSILTNIDKYAFSFHEKFRNEKVKVIGIVFLETIGEEIEIEKLKPSEQMVLLSNNIYRSEWLYGMRKYALQFIQLTEITKLLPAWKATRPKNVLSFGTFADNIIQNIIGEPDKLTHDICKVSESY